MLKNKRFLIGAVIILAAVSYLVVGGMKEAIVYFVTPSELKAKESSSLNKFLRMTGDYKKNPVAVSSQNIDILLDHIVQ